MMLIPKLLMSVINLVSDPVSLLITPQTHDLPIYRRWLPMPCHYAQVAQFVAGACLVGAKSHAKSPHRQQDPPQNRHQQHHNRGGDSEESS
jgi:hypothetical protein